jgi:hypothetical protein
MCTCFLAFQVARDKGSSLESTTQAQKDEEVSLKQSLKQRDLELEDLKRLHSSKVLNLQTEVAEEHRGFCDMQRRLEALTSQMQGREAAAAAAAAAHERALHEHDAQVLQCN